MKLEVSQLIEELNSLVPGFNQYWESDEASFNFGTESTIHGVFSDFSHVVISKIGKGSLQNPEQVFAFIEAAVASKGELSNAACTCFLENIANRVPNSISPNSFVSYLGVESSKFCNAVGL